MMTHRVYLLATPKRLESVARMMQRVGRWCIGFFHHLRRCRRTFWVGCYMAALVDSDPHRSHAYGTSSIRVVQLRHRPPNALRQ
jgi:hypothetical protein